MSRPVFASKYIADGKITKRKHGYKFNITANSMGEFEIAIPYNLCKLDDVEVIGCSKGDCVSLKVLDDDLGTISGTPKAVINQYGFAVNLPKDYYKDHSEYAADLFAGLYLKIEYQESEGIDKTIYFNMNFHEVL